MKQKEVLILFKTHLDVGFTDLSQNIVDKYLSEYIPTAIKIGRELQGTDTPFIWTVGSWLIDSALKNDADGSVASAVADGILNWHALPFTTHTELMNPALFAYGLDLSKKLDERFGKKTIAAKMTDVPGHTIGMVPQLYDRGVEFLHIGVNPATPLPPVPPIFRWKLDDKHITVMYQGDYGQQAEFEDFVVYFAHTGDNLGPQSADSVREIYRQAQAEYPGAILKAATLNDVAERLRGLTDLPVVDKEIGDTWIHGAATDPKKLSGLRHAMRNLPPDAPDVTDSLLLIPEHTWGMDIKMYFKDPVHYYPDEMEACKEERKTIESSWEEQRGYLKKAQAVMGLAPDYPVNEPDLDGFIETADTDCGIEVSWQLFDNTDYERYKKTYMRCHVEWAIWDFTKVGLPDYRGATYTAKVTRAWQKGETKLCKLEFPTDAAQKYGLPCFYLTVRSGFAQLNWYGKKACRLPQACWLKFKGYKESWQVNKLGHWIDVMDIVGSPLICAVDEGVRNGQVAIHPLDSALVAPFGRRLLQYNCGKVNQDMYFNLYNNIWNTNFPLWYSDDAVFRFTITEESK